MILQKLACHHVCVTNRLIEIEFCKFTIEQNFVLGKCLIISIFEVTNSVSTWKSYEVKGLVKVRDD